MGRVAHEAELARRLEDALEQQRAISGVLHAVARSTGLQPVLDEVVEACERLCKAEYAVLYLLAEGLLHAVAFDVDAAAAEYDRRHPHALDRTTAAAGPRSRVSPFTSRTSGMTRSTSIPVRGSTTER